MKIEKFKSINENNSLFGELWTKEKFNKINKLKLEIQDEEDSLKTLLKDYLLLNPNIQEQYFELNEDELYILSYNYTPHSTIKFTIWYRPEDDDFEDFEATLNEKKFNEFLVYLENPDLYIKSKKYNL